ncbi:MAG: right-handed parallel beta-helix repeat-containing protein, partial [Elusimicrobia bacterium]|nr:right-handed parallel beta-helix repeat-containing protein [Elusimicrobiota bacterium]
GGLPGCALTSAELYDPAAGPWAPTGGLSAARHVHSAPLLPAGKVLGAGGWNGSALTSAELYDPAAGTWEPTGAMNAARYFHPATLLADGKVLVAGGLDGAAVASAELYDPAARTWLAVGPLGTGRMSHTATLLPDGKVLVAGGWNAGVMPNVEVYDPAAGTWAATTSLTTARQAHTATLLPSGKVLVAGGASGAALTSAELYDPAAGTWAAGGSLGAARYNHTATLLPDGRVLAAGGFGVAALAGAELYDPAAGAWAAADGLVSARHYHTATLLPDGRVLAAGGDDAGSLASAETLFYSEYDFDISTKAFRRPRIDTVAGSAAFPVTLNFGVSYAVTGTTFTGVGEGSGGGPGSMNSPANAPRAYLRRHDSGGYGATAGGSRLVDLSTSIYGAAELGHYQNRRATATLNLSISSGSQCGFYSLSVVAGAVVSTAAAVRVAPPAPLASPVAFSPPFPRVFSSSITFRWAGIGPSADRYVVHVASVSDYSVVTSTSFSIVPSLSSTTAVGLLSNTTYFFRAAAENCGGLGPWSATLASTATLALLPAAAASTFPLVYPTSMTAAWLPGGNPVDVTTYTVVLTTGAVWPNLNLGNVVFSTVPAGPAPAATATGLGANTTYYLFVDARNWNNAGSGYRALGSTPTLALPPASAASTFTAVFQTSMTVSWLPNGNPLSVTSYTVVLSTGSSWPNSYSGNVTLTTRPAGAAPTATLAPLAADTTYYLFAAARNWGGLVSPYAVLGATSTLAYPPASAAATFPLVSQTSMTVAWLPGGNPVDVTTYTVVLTTGAVWPNLNLGNVVFSTVPAGPAPAATATGLGADTTYYLFVDARNWYDATSGYRALGSTPTFAYPPASAASTFTAVYATSMTAAWLPGGNPVDVTTYTVVLTTGAVWPNLNLGNVVFSTVPAGALPTATLTSLSANTTYSLFVDARNWSRASSGYAVLGSTSTMAAPPASAASTFTAVYATSMTVAWLPNGNPVDVTTYTVVLSTGSSWPNAFSGNQALSTAPAGPAPAATLEGLAADTTYYLYAAGVNWNGLSGGFSVLGASATRAFPPASAASTFSAVYFTSMTVAWLPGGNPVDVTTYTVVLTTGAAWPNLYSGNVLFSTVPAGPAPAATASGLTAETTYYLFADARNWHNASSGYAALGSTRTAAFPPLPAGLACATVLNVKKDGSGHSATIGGALALLPQSLAGNACLVIRDGGTYAEQVGVQGFANNGFRLSILADPALIGPAPTVSPPAASTGAFVVRNDSVTIAGINVLGAFPMPYGVLASSADIVLSSVNVDGGGSIRHAGIAISSWTSVLDSSVTVQNAYGLWVTGTGNAVTASTMAASGIAEPAIYLNGASWNTVTRCRAEGGIVLGPAADHNAIVRSTAIGAGWGPALFIADSDSTTVSQGFFFDSQNSGLGLFDSHHNTISGSTVASSAAGLSALGVEYSSYNSITESLISHPNGSAAVVRGGAYNTVAGSTLTGAGLMGLYLWQTSSATLSNSFVSGPAAVLVDASTGTVLNENILAPGLPTSISLGVGGGSVNLAMSTNVIIGGSQGRAIYLAFGNTGVIRLTSTTVRGAAYGLVVATQTAAISISSITFSGLAPGATAISFLGGGFISTFSYAVFADASVAINADGRLLGAGSHITLCGATGPRAGPLYENDPFNRVDWPAVCGAQTPLGGSFTLTVVKTGPGRITSGPPGIDCGPVCVMAFPAGTIVILGAENLSGSSFNGWGGACAGQGQCVLAMNADAVVTALFDPERVPLVNYPNPFGRGGTKFTYRLEKTSNVVIRIYTVSGRRVRTLQEAGRLRGYIETFWDGRNDSGEEVARGVYIYQLVVDDGTSPSVLTGKCAKRE